MVQRLLRNVQHIPQDMFLFIQDTYSDTSSLCSGRSRGGYKGE